MRARFIRVIRWNVTLKWPKNKECVAPRESWECSAESNEYNRNNVRNLRAVSCHCRAVEVAIISDCGWAWFQSAKSFTFYFICVAAFKSLNLADLTRAVCIRSKIKYQFKLQMMHNYDDSSCCEWFGRKKSKNQWRSSWKICEFNLMGLLGVVWIAHNLMIVIWLIIIFSFSSRPFSCVNNQKISTRQQQGRDDDTIEFNFICCPRYITAPHRSTARRIRRL